MVLAEAPCLGYGIASMEASSPDAESRVGHATEVPAAALSFLTTGHFTLQGAWAATISESTGRASTLLSAVSGGLAARSPPVTPVPLAGSRTVACKDS